MFTSEHIDRGTSTQKIIHHLSRYLGRISADARASNAMVSGEHIHSFPQWQLDLAVENGNDLRRY
jgi:hypothetical protein